MKERQTANEAGDDIRVGSVTESEAVAVGRDATAVKAGRDATVNKAGRDQYIFNGPLRVPLLVSGVLILLLLALVPVLARNGLDILGWVREQVLWRDQEERRLTGVAAGMRGTHFDAEFGAAVLATSPGDGRYTEKVYFRNGYWVQTVEDKSGTVKLFTVTSCRTDFNPTFSSNVGRATIGKTTLHEFADGEPTRLRYFASGATANSFFYEEYYRGRPGQYKTYIVGANDVCGIPIDQLREYIDLTIGFGFDASDVEPVGFNKLQRAQFDRWWSTPRFQALRRGIVVNTYGETDVHSDTSEIVERFQLGVDRVRVRALPIARG